MRIVVPIVNWRGLNASSKLCRGITPPARLEYLAALNSRITGACCGPYASPAFGAFLERAQVDSIRGAVRVNVATRAMRPFVVRGVSLDLKTATADDTSIFADSSGAASSDEILVLSPYDSGSEQWPPDYGETQTVKGALVDQPTPSAAQERLLEGPTDGELTTPVNESFRARRGLGLSFIPIVNADLRTL